MSDPLLPIEDATGIPGEREDDPSPADGRGDRWRIAPAVNPEEWEAAPGGWRAMLVDRWRIAQDRSVVGPGDPAEHLRQAEAMAAVLTPPSLAIDLGSGAGIPGLALAGIWPSSQWVLVDAARRRVRMLEESIEALGWADRVTAVHARAEDLGRSNYRSRADLVTSRLFGPPAVVAECGAPFLRPGGVLAVTEPPETSGDRWDSAGLRLLGLTPLGLRGNVQVLEADGTLSVTYPRRPGMPTKRPLF